MQYMNLMTQAILFLFFNDYVLFFQLKLHSRLKTINESHKINDFSNFHYSIFAWSKKIFKFWQN